MAEYIERGGKELFCTNCKNIPKYPQRKTNYCPNCGAKMDGDRSDE